MSPQTYLTVLTFVGLFVGFAGGIISQITKTSDEVDGRKKLTGPGRIALVISAIGFAGSFGSEVLKASAKAQEEMQAKLDATLREQKEKENKEWQGRSEKLQGDIKEDTKAALEVSEEHLKTTVDGFKREQEAILNTRLDIADSRQHLLNDNLLHEAKLYAKLGAAGTPLTSLTIRLTFDDVPRHVLDQVVAAQAAANAETAKAEADAPNDQTYQYFGTKDWEEYRKVVTYRRVTQPFIQLLAADRFAQQDGILAIGLDKRFSALACIGWIEKAEIVPKGKGKDLLPAGVLIDEEIAGDTLRLRSPRVGMHVPKIQLSTGRNSLELLIELDIFSFDDSVWRFIQSEHSAALPDDIELFSWAARLNEELTEDDLKQLELPFDSGGVHSSVLEVDLNKDEPFKKRAPDQIAAQEKAWLQTNAAWVQSNAAWLNRMPQWMRELRMQIVPNGISEISKTYRVTLSSSGYPDEGDRESYPRGYVRIWHGRVLKS